MAGTNAKQRRSPAWRSRQALLLGSAATVIAALGAGMAPARADCVPSGPGAITCSGNEIDGVNGSGNTSVTVQALNPPGIDPADGTPGILVNNSGGNAENGSNFPVDGENAEGGGDGVEVNVTFDDLQPIATGGTAGGIVAVSNGGLGGIGGDATISVIAGFGGHGGKGGNGGKVTVNAGGSITTTGGQSAGIQAQSSAGSGGRGGSANTLGGSKGGNGGAGGTGGEVRVNSTADITTGGDQSAGISATSFGGGGGTGGNGNAIGVGGGGSGGGTGPGGKIFVTSSGDIITGGKSSAGIYAQSVGGFAGGGGGGFVIGGGFGGDGQSAGPGGDIEVRATGGSITTNQENSAAIFAQSVGGGGGSGAFTGGLAIGALGGNGASGGDGGVVLVENSAKLVTRHANSSGIYAQSVGGGGGDGGAAGALAAIGGSGSAGGIGRDVTVRNLATAGNTNTIEVGGWNSYGIFAQSVGGGGGDGGAAGGIVSIGGSGSIAGNGGIVIVENSSNITSNCLGCERSGAIYAQSVGGGGGNGGDAGGLVAIGGSSSVGANGLAVTVKNLNNAKLETNANQSDGIFAQSIGGGGGRGGVSGGLVSIGGKGGGGGTGGAVLVEATGEIRTGGTDSSGIYAQSVGGGGGRGGTTGGVVAIGGDGGAGGNAGTVTVTNSATINTGGLGSEAIFAQSIGGGGGDGGVAGGWFAFGGKATGDDADETGGGDGQLVKVTNSGNLTTTNHEASAIFAQSVGGGGGNGGGAASGGLFAAFSMGGTGGKGGTGGEVRVNEGNNAGTPGYTINTSGDHSAGVFAQSIGGGGGTGGFSVAASFGFYAGASLSLGGDGGKGGNASNVYVGNNGTINTGGNFAAGISAQSTGGGGGDGGFSVAATVSTGAAASLAFGGKGDNAGDGRDVTVNSFTNITTVGTQSHGIFAHSAGGGGGSGGFAISAAGSTYGALSLGFGGDGAGGGAGGVVKVSNVGTIKTSGAQAHGILAESIGGGGGSGGFSVTAAGTVSGGGVAASLSFGGKGDGGGEGRAVEVNQNGDVTVEGVSSIGILAQSVGGGGGNGGFSGALSLAQGTAYGNSLGGAAGTASKAGAVTVTSVGKISTKGDNGTGILAQSVGGGGGNGGFSLALTATLDGSSTGQSVGGKGGGGGAGDNVTVHHTGGITTEGHLAVGILAQSVGGGGGNGGFSAGAALTLDGDADLSSVGGQGGDAADLTIENETVVKVTTVARDVNDKIVTSGTMSHGIQAQSIGGGGGNGGFALGAGLSINAAASSDVGGGGSGGGGNSGHVEVYNGLAIETDGYNSVGVFAQSIGGGGGTGGLAIGLGLSGGEDDTLSNAVGGSGGGGGHANTVRVDNYAGANILTKQTMSHGIQAQSIGGGGGSGGFAIGGSLSLEGKTESSVGGGSGAGGGNGARVDVTNGANIDTQGIGSIGIFAQSVGGGGGSGGFAISAGISGGGDSDDEEAGVLSNAIGGNGAAGGNGGIVNVTNNAGAKITTQRDQAHGILAQSVGGGGGNGGFAIGGALALEGKTESKVGGGQGSGGGTGNDVTVVNGGGVETRGRSAVGILAQSVGGGGGNGGFAISLAGSMDSDAASSGVGGSGGTASGAGAVKVTNQSGGKILTTGVMSHGIQAQSIGGGGGNGGFAIGAGLSIDGAAQSDVGGGSAGAGGSAGIVEVINDGQIDTQGMNSIGIFAQSVGGGGGSGGFAITGALGSSGVSNGIGGKGGGGSNGNTVTVTNRGQITTGEVNSIGILAQSIGGGGGNGAFSLSATVAMDSGATSSAIGGGGSAGGNGGTVIVGNEGTIITNKALSTGILAQSIGGGGGNGGLAVAGSLGGDGGTTSTVGGNGGAGGNGGDVTVTNSGRIEVRGDSSFGIFAQSVGGGGGSGGFSGGLAAGGSLGNVVGGAGGKGGDGGDVTVISTGSIITSQDNSSAVFAQSVAGSGGWGGLSIGLGDGGDGSTGVQLGLGATGNLLDGLPVDGAKGTVTVTINGATTVTEGGLSYGLLAQSIAGGGGAAGTVLKGLLDFVGSDVDMALGNNGSMMGDASFQQSSYSNATTTNGLGSIGLISQSIGGGGGTSGLLIEAVSLNPNGADNFNIRVGGYSAIGDYDPDGPDIPDSPAGDQPVQKNIQLFGGGSGAGFSLTAKGTVTTQKDNAIGLVGQSIGGGGGIGNITVGTVTNTANKVNLTLGGAQLHKGNAGAPSTLIAEQKVTTVGILSHGVVAQSIGGGGGVSNVVFQQGIAVSGGIAITLGNGEDGLGGDGGNLSVTTADVQTTGKGAFGIVAQSIGGGGGLANIANAGKVIGESDFALARTITAGSGAGGIGGTVTVIATGDVRTSGFGAHGIVAQSIGGGGGIVGAGMFTTEIAATGAFAGSVGGVGTGAGGLVKATSRKNIVVIGQNAVGMLGQSAGGDGGGNIELAVEKSGNNVGLVWASSGTGAAVQFLDGATNSLKTEGTLYAQGSIYGSGLPNLDGLAVLGGTGDETITNLAYAFPAPPAEDSGLGYAPDYGVVLTMASGLRVDEETGEPIADIGTRTNNVIGDIDLSSGSNNFVNATGALLISNDFVRLDNDGTPEEALGVGQTLTNSGLLSPGDRARVKTTAVSGNFLQDETGNYFIDVDLVQQNTGNPVHDRLDMTGEADFDGQGSLLLLSIDKAFDEYVIASATGGMTDSGFDPTLTPPTVGFDFNVRVEGNNLVLYADKPPFSDLLRDPDSGTRDPNVFRMGEGVDRIEQAISVDDPFNYLINLLRLQPDVATLGAAFITLTPSQAPHFFEVTYRGNMNFLDDITACPVDVGQGWFDERRNCLWGQGSYAEYRRESVSDSPTNSDQWASFTMGGQAAVTPEVQLGFGFDYSSVDSTQEHDGEYLSDFDGDLYQGGLAAGYRHANGFGVGLVAAGSYGTWEARRRVQVDSVSQLYTSFDGIGVVDGVEQPIFSQKEIVFDGISGIARSDPHVGSLAGRVRFSYQQSYGTLQVTPFFDIDGYVIRTDERTEYGVGLANLTYPEVTETAVTFTPGIQFDSVAQLDEKTTLRGFLRGSAVLAPDAQWEAETQFVAAPEGLPPIKIIDSFDDVLGKVDAGVTVLNTTGQQLQIYYGGQFGETTMQHQVTGGFTQRF